MSVYTLLIILLVILLIGGLPVWPYAAGFGYGPSGIIGLILVVLLVVLLVRGRI